MAKHLYALEPGGPKRLEVSHGIGFTDLEVKLYGRVIVSASDKAALTNGLSAKLPDGAMLEVKLEDGLLSPELSVRRNGVPLPGSAKDPWAQVRDGANYMFLLAALNAIAGVVVMTVQSKALAAMGNGVGQFAYAGLFAVLGFFAMKGSFAAPVIAIVFWGADTLFTLVAQVESGNGNFTFLFLRIFVIYMLVRAAAAARELKAKRKEGAAAPPAAAA